MTPLGTLLIEATGSREGQSQDQIILSDVKQQQAFITIQLMYMVRLG